MTYFFDRDAEAARISFAGMLVTLRATGIDVVEASLDYPNDPVLKTVPEQIMAGFDHQDFGKGDLENCVEKFVLRENSSMVRRMVFAQLRAILAGRSALEYADFTGALDLLGAPASRSSEVWAQRLLEAFGGFLDFDEETKEALFHRAFQDADRVVGRSWELVGWVYHSLKSGDDDIAGALRSSFSTDNTEEFSITASGAETLWREVEEEVASLLKEQ